MVVRYSSLNRLERPKMTLCNPGSVYEGGYLSKVVGILCDHEAEELALNFNATSELSFRISRVRRDDSAEDAEALRLYRAVQNRRLIFVDDIGYFVITEVKEGFEGKRAYKDVRAESADVEIMQKMVPFIEDGTYPFSTVERTGQEPVKGIFDRIVETLPMWTIGHVDSAVSQRWRTFEDVDDTLNCLAFLTQNLQDAYECIVLFDTVNRVINVYDQNNYVRRTDIHLTRDDVINSLDISENAEDVYTAISVMGDENVTISAINPVGTNVMYNFNYYLSWMSDELRSKVEAWQQAVEDIRAQYYSANLEYFQKMTQAADYEAEIGRIDIQLTMYRRCRNNIVASGDTSTVAAYNTAIIENGGTAIVVYQEIADTLSEIDGLIAACESQRSSEQAALDQLNQQIAALRAAIEQMRLPPEEAFSASELEELQNYIYEGSYTDEYVTITSDMSYDEKFAQMKTLYDRALTQLQKVSVPTQEFSIDAENFLFIKAFEHWSEQLETGCLINVELEEDDLAALFLAGITVNYDDHKLSLKFGNRFNRFDPKSLFDDVLGSVSRSANTLSYVKDLIAPLKNGEYNAMKETLQNSRNLTMQGALSSTDEEVVIDGSGYTGRKKLPNGEYDPRQVKITGKSIVFTDDSWESSKVALGEIALDEETSVYGVNAEVVVGDLIMGSELRILGSDGRDIMDVTDDHISTRISQVYIDAATAPTNPSAGQLWLDTSVTPSLMRRWNGLSWEVVNDTTGLAVGGRNLMLNTATNFPDAYSGAAFTKTSGVAAEEWACTDAFRIAGTSGTYGVFALFNNSSHGLALKGGSNFWRTKTDQDYVYSMYLKNNHATSSVKVRMNAIGSGYVTVAPGAVMRWWDTGKGNGTAAIQINLATDTAGDEFDVTFWHPMVEYGNRPSDWSPAPEDVTAEITDAAGAVQTNLDNMSIGGRNYLLAMDGVSLTPTTVNCTYSYDHDTGTYTLVGREAAGQYAQIYCNQYNGIDVPARLIGKDMILHADAISCSNSACTPRVYLNFMNESNEYLKTYVLTPDILQLTLTVPEGAAWMRATLRIDENLAHQEGDTLTVSGLMLEEGTHRSAWVPAEEDGRRDVELKVQSVSAKVDETADSIRADMSANYVLASDMNTLAESVRSISEQTAENFTWSVTRTQQLQADLDTASGNAQAQLQTINSYMQFTEDGLRIGRENDDFSLLITNNRIIFYNANAEVAYLSDDKLYINNGEILTTLILGRFAFDPQPNGNLSLTLNAV